MTIVSYIMDGLLASAAVWMFLRGHFMVTRELALVPLLTAAADAAFAAQLTPELTPIISAALLLLQAVILFVSVALTAADRAKARRKEERYRRRMQLAQARDAFDHSLEEQEKKRRSRKGACA